MQDELLARVWVLGFVGPSLEPGSKGAIRMRVVVLGGSFGGITASYELRKALPREHEIVLVSNSSLFVYRPSLPFVALGSRRPEDITAELKPALRRRGIAFQQATVQGIDPLARRVATTAGPIDYDYLVVALGAHLDREAVPGLDPHTDCIMWLDDALRVREKLEAFEGGDIVVLEVEGTPAPCPASELVGGLDDYLRRRGLRSKSRIHYLTHAREPFDVAGPRASRLVARELDRKGIHWQSNTRVRRVGRGRVEREDGLTLEADLIFAFPPYRGTMAALRSQGLANEKGFIPVHTTMESRSFPRIYAVGDAVAFAGPKSGRMAELQARVAAHNIACQILGRGAYRNYQSHLVCAMDLGGGRGMFAYRKEAKGQGSTYVSFATAGRWPVWFKSALEKYFLTAHFGT